MSSNYAGWELGHSLCLELGKLLDSLMSKKTNWSEQTCVSDSILQTIFLVSHLYKIFVYHRCT
mgnify:CR=1 FL=1